MGIKEAFGAGSVKKVRYAIVGIGDIAQEDMMPGVDHPGNLEPDGEEGFADVRVIEGVLGALNSGGSVQLPPFRRTKRADTQAQKWNRGLSPRPNWSMLPIPARGSISCRRTTERCKKSDNCRRSFAATKQPWMR